MNDLLTKLKECIEIGKVEAGSPYPPHLKDENGADEYTELALEAGLKPEEIITHALVRGMQNVGEKFGRNEIFIPDVLMAARAMEAAMKHLKPFFQTGELRRKGTLIIGTVAGDLHDIGKNIVGLIVEGGGWEVMDLGVDVPAGDFLTAMEERPGAIVGLSTLLTTTMVNMKEAVESIKSTHPGVKVIVGGAPITHEFAHDIGADAYSPDPQGAVEFLNSILGRSDNEKSGHYQRDHQGQKMP